MARENLLVCFLEAASWPFTSKLMNLWDTEASKSFLKSCICSQHKATWKMVANVSNILGLSMSASQKKSPVAKVVLRVTDRQICNDFLLKVLCLKLLPWWHQDILLRSHVSKTAVSEFRVHSRCFVLGGSPCISTVLAVTETNIEMFPRIGCFLKKKKSQSKKTSLK